MLIQAVVDRLRSDRQLHGDHSDRLASLEQTELLAPEHNRIPLGMTTSASSTPAMQFTDRAIPGAHRHPFIPCMGHLARSNSSPGEHPSDGSDSRALSRDHAISNH
ncbi:MAG: hypothetical protein AB7W59_22730 [Acidimicrobiia bacterium]